MFPSISFKGALLAFPPWNLPSFTVESTLSSPCSRSTFQPENSNFLDVKMVQPHLDLADCTSVEAEFDVAKT